MLTQNTREAGGSELICTAATNEKDQKSYESLLFSLSAAYEIHALLQTNDKKCCREWIMTELNIPVIQKPDFDPCQKSVVSPDFEYEDFVARQTIFADYFVHALKFSANSLFNSYQTAIWATVFHSTHEAYVEKLGSGELGTFSSRSERISECFGLFRRNLYKHCFPVSAERRPFAQHQIKSLVDYFFNNYIVNLNLITDVYSLKQTRVVYRHQHSLMKPIPCTPLSEGVLEDQWESYLVHKKEALEREEQARLSRETECLADENQADSTMLLAPFPSSGEEFRLPSPGELFGEPEAAHGANEEETVVARNVYDKSSIKEILDSVNPYFDTLNSRVEDRLNTQMEEMNVRVEKLRTVLESRKQQPVKGAKGKK